MSPWAQLLFVILAVGIPCVTSKLQITSPKPRDEWFAGSKCTVSWSSSKEHDPKAPPNTLKIELVRGTGSLKELFSGAEVVQMIDSAAESKSGTMSFDLKENIPPGSNYRIRIVTNGSGFLGMRKEEDISGPFTIAKQVVAKPPTNSTIVTKLSLDQPSSLNNFYGSKCLNQQLECRDAQCVGHAVKINECGRCECGNRKLAAYSNAAALPCSIWIGLIGWIAVSLQYFI
jgi:hypothetical protein